MSQKKLIDSAQLCYNFVKQLLQLFGVSLVDGRLGASSSIEEVRRLAGIPDAQWTLLLAELSEFDLISAIADAEEVILTQDAEREAIRAMEDEDSPSANDADTETEDQPATGETTENTEATMTTVVAATSNTDPAVDEDAHGKTIPSAPPGPDQEATGWETVTTELQDAGQPPDAENSSGDGTDLSGVWVEEPPEVEGKTGRETVTYEPQGAGQPPVTVGVEDDADIAVTSATSTEEAREPDTDPPPGGSAPEMIPPHPAEVDDGIERPARTMLDASPEPIPPDESEAAINETPTSQEAELPLQTSPFGLEIPMPDRNGMAPGDATDTISEGEAATTDEDQPCSTPPEASAEEEGECVQNEDATPNNTIVADAASPATKSNEGGTSEASTEDNPPPRTPEEVDEALDRR